MSGTRTLPAPAAAANAARYVASSSARAPFAEALAAPPLRAYDDTILGDDPIAFYRLDDVTKLLHDVAPNPKHGNHGSAETLGVAGLTSANYTAALFPGGNYDPTNVAAVLPNAKFQTPTVSVEAWVSPSVPNTSNRFEPMVAYGRFHIGTSYHLSVTPINQFMFSVHTVNGSPVVTSSTSSWPGHTFHLVGTYDGSSLKLYVNGVLEGRTAASGAIDYDGLYSWTGLAIGSGFDALPAHPIESYAGRIADVAIYDHALTPALVMSHYLAGVATPAITERAVPADTFVDSIGVNAPFNYSTTHYNTGYATIQSLLIASGIRHIRAGLAMTAWQTYYDRLNELGRAGIHSELVTLGTETASQLRAFPALVAQSMEAFEGPNEPDLAGNPNWVGQTRAFMKLLYTAVKSSSATAHLPVVAPSIVNSASTTAFGNLSADLDFGNIHPYYGQHNPGNWGFGDISSFGRYGSTQYQMNVGAAVSGTKPIYATETGFGTDIAYSGNVSELCDGKVMLRTFFVHYLAGMPRTYMFQFVESGAEYGPFGPFSYMGLVRDDLAPKPSYNAVKSIIGLLSDRGSAFTPAPLTYTIRGDVSNLQHLLMQKRDGTYYLALWLEVPSWNPSTEQDVNAVPQAISVSVPGAVQSGSLYTLGDAGAMSVASVPAHAGTLSLDVSDRISVLAFKP